jgi:hypothetical protein
MTDGDDGMSRTFAVRLKILSEACTGCDLCEKEYAFVRKCGKPKDIADRHDPSVASDRTIPLGCSLCELCKVVCPVDVDPSGLFLEMKKEACRRRVGTFPEHCALTAYEHHGTSRRYFYYGLPQDCDTVFFPGCTLSGPPFTYREHLRPKSWSKANVPAAVTMERTIPEKP